MTELERKALMGDRDAQEECTRQGIVLPCPFCGGIPVRKTQKVEYGLSGTIIKCTQCHATIFSPDTIAKSDGLKLVNKPVLNHIELGIAKWNTRPAPPVGRCKECQHYVAEWVEDGETIPAECIHPLTGLLVVNDDDFCSYFEPKGDEGNEAQSCKS